MSPLRPSLESTSSTAFYESLSSVSSVRDSLPEQHRAHFETLRDEIIDFVEAHEIPRDTLNKPDALREAAKKLSILDLTQLATLLERFEYLLVHKEPREEIPEALEYVEKFYHLEKQYTSQVELLEEVGVLENGTILGIDGKRYPVPTLEQIAIRLFERREELSTKHDQGFTKLLLVPFGMSLDSLRETLKQFLLKYKKDNPTFDLDTDKPLRIWEEGYQGADMGDSPELVYYPQSFTKEGHGGKTKMEILQTNYQLPTLKQSSFPGWTIHLLQPSNLESQDTGTPTGFAPIPRQGQGTTQGDKVSRPPLEAGQSPIEYLSILQEAKDNEDLPYHGESGLTPEDWIMAFMLHLSETRQQLDNYANDIESSTYLAGAFLHSSVGVPFAYWYYKFPHAYLGGFDPRNQDERFGTRFSVMV